MIKIDLILPYLSGQGGTETVLSSWSDYFKGHKDICLRLVAPQGVETKCDIYDDLLTHDKTLKSRIIRNVHGALWLKKYIHNSDADIVICLTTKLISLVSTFKKIFKKSFTIISWIHFSIFHGTDIDPKKLKNAEYHLAISTGIKEQLKQIGISEKKIFFIGNPINRKNKILKNNESNFTKFLYLGRLMLDGEKNFRELLQICKTLKGNWLLDVYGDGEDKEVIQKIIKENGLDNKISLLGWKNNPWDLIRQADCTVLCSTHEGFGMVLAESISYGVPCISSNCPYGPKDIINSDNGCLYELGDSAQLKYLMEEFIKKEQIWDPYIVKESIEFFYKEKYFSRIELLAAMVSKRD